VVEKQDGMPDPGRAGDLAEFVGLLGELRAWAGLPSYRVLAKRVGPLMRPPQVVSPSTVVDAFKSERRRLDLDLVVAIVRALGVDEAGTACWREACVRVHGLAKRGGPVGVFSQLPTDLPTFTGRREDLARLIAAATHHHEGGSGTTVVVSAIEGMAGVGKTQLAVHAAHQLVRAGHFTDAQLHVNLRGFDPELPPADPSTVLEAFLRQLGVPAQQIPAGRDERAAMYRDRLRERHALILLDNAADEDQVRDLIPASPSCLVLVTSRRSLAGLDGVTPHLIDTFSEAESLELLIRIAGRDRVISEPEAAVRIVRSCDHLPLALALAAARLRSRPAWSLSELADRLEAGQLEALRAGGRAIRPMFDVSYRALPEGPRELFRLLGLHPGPDFSPAAAAALSGSTIAQATEVLELLLDEHLLEQRRTGRYELHDLLRAYSLDLIGQDGEIARETALTRITTWYTHSVYNAMTALQKEVESPTVPCVSAPAQFDSHDAALAWLSAEETNLEQAMRTAADCGLHDTVWQTGRLLRRIYSESGRIADSARVSQMAAESARRAGNLRAEGQALCDVGWARAELARHPGPELDEAEALMRRAVDLCGGAGNEEGQAYALNGLAKVLREQRRHAEALDCYEAALTICQKSGASRRIGVTHCNIGTLHFAMEDYDLALASYLRSLEILDAPEADSFGITLLLGNIAEIYLLTGEHDRAQSYETRRLALARAYGYTLHEAESLLVSGDIQSALGNCAGARRAWTESAILYEQLDDPRAAEVRRRLRASPDVREGANG
jgi:tetratricopeptide (TPR) repeat protein